MKNNTAIILIAISITLFITFTRDEYRAVQDLYAEAGVYQKILDDISNIIDTRDRLLLAYNDLPRRETERLQKLLPDRNDTVRLALDLDGVASRFDISLNSIQTEVTTPANGGITQGNTQPYETATVSFSFVSNYSNFVSFLSELERSLRIMDVRSTSFRVDDESGIYEHRVSVDTYWLR